ncbi:MAG: hypothetical protein ACYCST_11235 [Acidimicrobiales bacterium]
MSDRADPQSRQIADRHYNRQKIGSTQFVPPGRCLVLRTFDDSALWVTSWPFAALLTDPWVDYPAWPGAFMCSAFRNETGAFLSSDLIRSAVAHTRWTWLNVPDIGMITFVDAKKVRYKRDPGRCFLRAGFHNVGYTKGGLVALQLLPSEMPDPEPVPSDQGVLFETHPLPAGTPRQEGTCDDERSRQGERLIEIVSTR